MQAFAFVGVGVPAPGWGLVGIGVLVTLLGGQVTSRYLVTPCGIYGNFHHLEVFEIRPTKCGQGWI